MPAGVVQDNAHEHISTVPPHLVAKATEVKVAVAAAVEDGRRLAREGHKAAVAEDAEAALYLKGRKPVAVRALQGRPRRLQAQSALRHG